MLGTLENTVGLEEASGCISIVGGATGDQIDRANACALILNELVVNAYKHGLKGRSGEIDVALARRDNEIILEVRDPGEGFNCAQAGPGDFRAQPCQRACQQIGKRFEIEAARKGVCRVIAPFDIGRSA